MNYPIGIQDFKTLRTRGFVYVDKTELVYKLTRGHVYFLGRPRRFGKSLLVSTLKYYFQGQKELFEGLKIMDLETEWQQYPVLHFDFNGIEMRREEGLREYLNSIMQKEEKKYGVEPDVVDDAAQRFRNLIEGVHANTGQQVVVLVDEYDKPLLDLLETDNPDDERKLNNNRELLKAFFSTFKAADEHLRFVLLTGITKFSQVSMFSGFNQPDDISLSTRYEALCGITEEELYTVFAESICRLAEEEGQTIEEIKTRLKEMFDGYHFSKKLTDIYNPFSIINTFAKNDVRSYWFKSGTPSYIVRLLARCNEDVMQFTGHWFQEQQFIDYEADVEMPLPMIFQGGYLTIKEVDREFGTFLLDFPNREVREGFVTLLTNNYIKPREDTASWVLEIVRALRMADLDTTRRLFTSFLAETPYTMRPKKDQKDRELYFHYTFYLLMRLISCYTVYTEKQMSEGRADCIVETPKYVYIFEFKLDGTAQEALQQIHERGYARSYEADARKKFLVGVSFSSQTGTTEEWQVEEL